MRKSLFVLAAAFALPHSTPLLSQAPAAIDLDQYPPSNGAWSYRVIEGGTEAVFAVTASTQRLTLRCNRVARTVAIIRSGLPAAAPTLTVWTTTLSRSVPARFEANGNLTADLAARDALLDAIAFSRGRFATAAAGAPMLTVPTWPEVSRVIEDCRS